MSDIIVLDVMMESRGAGFELAREIHKTYPEMPTIMLTSVHEATGVPYRFEPDESWLPVVKFMDKPVDPAKLADEIEATLKRIAEEKEKEKQTEKMTYLSRQKQFLSSMMILILLLSRKSSLKKPVLMSSLPTARNTPKKYFRRYAPDLAIVDLMMEYKDSGFALCYHIKKKDPSIPVILVTAVTS